MEKIDQIDTKIPIIKIIGVGGAGGNAINNMIEKGLDGVVFIALNTDFQDLEKSKAEMKIQIGRKTTLGLGAGMDVTKGAKAVEENSEEIKQIINGCDMVFITAGMGGGTGTGGAPVIAKIAKATGALVVAIVTKPFDFEGSDRLKIANAGLMRLKKEVDACIVIPNEKLLTVFGDEITFENSFKRVDDVLYNSTRGISDIITKRGKVNVSFADVKTIMQNMGDAIMGIGYAKGEDKAIRATCEAIDNPLLEGVSIKGAKSILLNIIADNNFKTSELKSMTELIMKTAGEYTKLIWGVVTDDRMEDEVIVTVIATCFNDQNINLENYDISNIDYDSFKGTTIVDRIKFSLDRRSISIYKLCKDCNIPRGTFSQISKGKFNFRIEHLVIISKYLGLSLDELVLGLSDKNKIENLLSQKNKSKKILFESKDTVITKIPSSNKELEYYDIPTVHRKRILQPEDKKTLRAKTDENDIDFNISDEDKPAFIRRQMD
ncbi:MAG: cell division protein FtsZ [Ignavibacteriae bacterium]|nr:MAG: cell division protein FtsZ [Ignavibacteriota bacterium]